VGKLHPCSARRGQDPRGCELFRLKEQLGDGEVRIPREEVIQGDLSRSYENDWSHGNFFQTGFKETALPPDCRGKHIYRVFFLISIALLMLAKHQTVASLSWWWEKYSDPLK